VSVTDKALKVVAEQPASVPTVPAPPLFATDAPNAGEAPARAAFLAELALHERVATPLCVGLFGTAGTGKSTLLRATLEAATALGGAAREAGLATPFLGHVPVIAATLQPGVDPADTVVSAVHDALAEAYPDLVSQAEQAHDDPHASAEAARDRLDQLRQRLDGERRRLDELTARQARLVETVLFESSGSQVDTYARAHRGRIDKALRRFGFGPDTMTAYKELVRDHAEPGAGRFVWLSSVWAYRGQVRLLVVAVAFFVLFWALGLLIDNQDGLLDALRGSNERFAPVADWLAAHAAWLLPARQVAGLAGLAALAINVIRAIRFCQPIARGARLLRGDMEARRRDIDGLVAHQAQRVETVARDVEAASARAAAAEARLTRTGAVPAIARPARRLPRGAAQMFFATIGHALIHAAGERSNVGAPARLVVGLDGFERLSSPEAAAALETAHALLGRPGIVSFVALDRDGIASGFAEADPALAAAALDRIVQVPVAASIEAGAREQVQALLRAPARSTGPVTAAVPDVTQSALDKAWLPKESALLEALAPFAGATPRAVKRFVNIYRVARADPAMQSATPADYATLALGLAAQAQGLQPEILSESSPDGGMQELRQAAAAALGMGLELARDARGFAVARRYAAH
jgi:hypothetical protein